MKKNTKRRTATKKPRPLHWYLAKLWIEDGEIYTNNVGDPSTKHIGHGAARRLSKWLASACDWLEKKRK